MLSMFAPVLLAFLRPDIPGWGRGPFPLSGLHKLPSPPDLHCFPGSSSLSVFHPEVKRLK